MATMTESLADKKRLLSFAVVGGGATGVETVAELAEFALEIKKRYYKQNKKYKLPEVSIYLISSGPEILKPFNAKIRHVAEEHLREIGVNIMLSVSVSSVEFGVINLDGRKTVLADTIIWAGGVTPTVPKFLENQPENVAGRLSVNKFLQMKNQKNVFVLGDSAWAEEKEEMFQQTAMSAQGRSTSAAGRPMLAQVAVAQSKIVAQNIMAGVSGLPMSSFVYKSKGNFISLGQWFAAGEIFGLTIYGKITWWIWRTTYLFNFASWEKRLKIAFEWSLNLFLPRDTTKLS
jgi:NADH dehydrogenase